MKRELITGWVYIQIVLKFYINVSYYHYPLTDLASIIYIKNDIIQ